MLHIYKHHRSRASWIFPIFLFCVMLTLFWAGFTNAADSNIARDMRVMRSSVRKAIVSCYACEGFYPADFSYLEDHYGVVIDYNKYVVRYELAGSNIMPSVEILQRGNE